MKMKNNFTFDTPELAAWVGNALFDALENIMPDLMDDNNLIYRNGYGQFSWNVIIQKLSTSLGQVGWIKFGLCKRGGWYTPVLYNKQNGDILTFMTEKTFKRIQKRKDKGRHYLSGAASFNNDIKASVEQIEMPITEIESRFEKFIVKSSEELAKAINSSVSEINGHILILFNTVEDKIITLRAVRLTRSLEISIEEENWKPYLPHQNNSDIEIELDSTEEDDESGDGLVTLR